MSYPILLTGTINVKDTAGGFNSVTITDINERLEQYNKAIERFITKSVFDKIVFVETTNYQFDYSIFISLAEKYNKQFEYITFRGNNEKVKEKGKSYGEAEAIIYGIKNSKLLKNEDTIYKITGRLFLNNSEQIVKTKNKARNEFLSHSKLDNNRCITYFFKINKSDYIEYFSDVQYFCDQALGMDIESVFYKKIIDNRIEQKPFKKYPRITGVHGGMDGNYDRTKFKYFLSNILLKVGFFTVK